MPRMIFVDLPVTDLKASMAFYESLGFANNPHFSDETGAWADAKGFSHGGEIRPEVKAGQLVAAVTEELGLGHGHTMAIVALLKGAKQEGVV